MNRRALVLCAMMLAAFAPGRIAAAPVAYWFDKAAAHYEQQAYDSAAQYYEKILSSGLQNSAVYYNLGNCDFRLKKIGAAILNYEKANALSPNDPDIIANIRFANTAIIDRIPAPQQTFLGAVLERAHTLIPLKAQLWIMFILLLALGILFSLGLFAAPNARLWIMYVSALLFLIAGGLGISAGVKIYNSEQVSYAIVLSPSLDAKNQPSGNKVLFTVHEGTKFRVRKTIGDWSLVSLPTGASGWVLSSSLGRI
jgi:tetratricopeptide (TPR) repeat protein